MGLNECLKKTCNSTKYTSARFDDGALKAPLLLSSPPTFPRHPLSPPTHPPDHDFDYNGPLEEEEGLWRTSADTWMCLATRETLRMRWHGFGQDTDRQRWRRGRFHPIWRSWRWGWDFALHCAICISMSLWPLRPRHVIPVGLLVGLPLLRLCRTKSLCDIDANASPSHSLSFSRYARFHCRAPLGPMR